MNYRNRWLLVLAALTTLSVFLIAAGQTPGRVYLPVIVKEWQSPPTPTATVTPTPTSLPEYLASFSENLSVTSINGSEANCRVDNGCTLFLIQVRNLGNRPVRYWVTKTQTVRIGWGVYFCWSTDCFFGNEPAPKVLTPGQRENIAINFRVPSVLVDGEVAVVDVRGYYACDGCPDPTVYQPYTNQFRVLVILPTPTSPTRTPTPTVTPTPTLTPTWAETGTPTPTPTSSSTPYYGVTFTEDLSATAINGTEPGCREAAGCTLFQIQVRNVGNRPVEYQLSKTQTLPLGWAAFFCWAGECEFGNLPPPRTLAIGQRETAALNFRIPTVLHNGDVGTVDVMGTCPLCSQPDYRNEFTVHVVLPTQTCQPPSTGTQTPTPTATFTLPSD